MDSGRRVKCPGCGQYISVPNRFHDHPCPKCDTNLHDERNHSQAQYNLYYICGGENEKAHN